MKPNSANPSIQCSVTQCAYHCGDRDYCSLSSIRVGRCASQVNNSASTECASFELRGGGRVGK
jgi:hypothetical protein